MNETTKEFHQIRHFWAWLIYYNIGHLKFSFPFTCQHDKFLQVLFQSLHLYQSILDLYQIHYREVDGILDNDENDKTEISQSFLHQLRGRHVFIRIFMVHIEFDSSVRRA